MKKKLIWIVVALIAAVIVLVMLKKNGVIGKEEGIKVTAEKAELRTIIETVNAAVKYIQKLK